jgi:hypothetical protein
MSRSAFALSRTAYHALLLLVLQVARTDELVNG